MRVALIGPVPPELGGATPGGVATHQVQLAAGLAAAGVCAPLLATNTRVSAAAWRVSASGSVPFAVYRMGLSGWPDPGSVSSLGPRRIARYGLYLAMHPSDASRREVLAQLVWYRRFLAEVRPAVVHVQHPLERCSYARRVLQLEGWRLPLVVTAHSLFGEHAPATIHGLMAPNLRAARRVIAVNDHVADQAIELGVAAERIHVIRSGVDTRHFQPGDRRAARQALGIGQDVPLVLFVGNLEPRKQVDVLLRALAQLRQRLPGVALRIIGSGQSAGALDQTPRLVELTAQLGLSQAVTFVGRVADQQLREHYAAADVLALPSSSEAQGIVALEAMACGLPVVASQVGGLRGAIDDGVSGFLVPAGDPAALAERLGDVLTSSPDRRQSLATAARQRVEHDFSWQRSVEATRSVYAEAVGECPARSMAPPRTASEALLDKRSPGCP